MTEENTKPIEFDSASTKPDAPSAFTVNNNNASVGVNPTKHLQSSSELTMAKTWHKKEFNDVPIFPFSSEASDIEHNETAHTNATDSNRAHSQEPASSPEYPTQRSSAEPSIMSPAAEQDSRVFGLVDKGVCTASAQNPSSPIYAGVIGGIISMILTVLVLPYWSNANNVSVDMCHQPRPGSTVPPHELPLGCVPTNSLSASSARPETSTDNNIYSAAEPSQTAQTISAERWSEVQAQNNALFNRIDMVNKELAGLSNHLSKMGELTERVNSLDGQLRSVMTEQTRILDKPSFVATAIKKIGGESWVTVIESNGNGTMLRHGESLRDWRVHGIDHLAGVVVFEHHKGSRHRITL